MLRPLATAQQDVTTDFAVDDSESEAVEDVEVAPASPAILERGRRKKTENKRYRSELREGH